MNAVLRAPMSLSISELATLVQGTVLGAPKAASLDRLLTVVAIDSRACSPGSLFISLVGERVDGHDFLSAAQANGAVAALVQREDAVGSEAPPESTGLIRVLVADVQQALLKLAKAWLSRLPTMRIGLTGSNGKTTVKNLTSSILSQVGPCFATHGNLNNEIGLPLSALSVREGDRFAVLEMGAGQPGDIETLADVVRPQIALVNNAMAAHLERLGSIAGVAQEKAAVYRKLSADGIAVVNLDDPNAALFQTSAQARGAAMIGFSLHAIPEAIQNWSGRHCFASNIYSAERCEFTLHCEVGECQIKLALLGEHNIRNALAAAAIAIAAGAQLHHIQAGLESVRAEPGRLRAIKQPAGWTLLDDSYNANPGSLMAGIDALCGLPGEPWLVLGNMAELGADELALHAELGRYAAKKGVRQLWCVGEKAAHASVAARDLGMSSHHFEEQASLIAALSAALRPEVNLLVKGSRSSRTENIIAAVCDSATQTMGVH